MAIYNGGLNIIAPDISGKEDKSNKVTAWSSTTTDTHYPSENLVKSALDTKVNTANVLSLEEIQASTDLTGKIASASVIKDSVFTIKNVSTAKYIQFGKLVVVKFAAVISEDVFTSLPSPSQFIVITLRDNNNGKFASFYMDNDAVIKTYMATNYTPGNFYSGTFAYITD